MKPVFRGENGYIYETEAEAAEADRIQAEKEAAVAPYRRLDILFTEKVLKFKKHPIPDPDLRPAYMRTKEPNFTLDEHENKYEEKIEYLGPAPQFSKSLDKTMEHIKDKFVGNHTGPMLWRSGGKWVAAIGEPDAAYFQSTADTAAEALVKACIRAVGDYIPGDL